MSLLLWTLGVIWAASIAGVIWMFAAPGIACRRQERRDYDGCVADALAMLEARDEAEYLDWLERTHNFDEETTS